jgi:hypothetical protein
MRPQGDQYLYLPQFFLVQIVLGLDVVVNLHVDPVPLRQPEGAGKPQTTQHQPDPVRPDRPERRPARQAAVMHGLPPRSNPATRHPRALDRWESLVGQGDVLSLHRILTGLDRDSIEMREVSPMGGLLPRDERQAALRTAD